jgi:hypothetical protein
MRFGPLLGPSAVGEVAEVAVPLGQRVSLSLGEQAGTASEVEDGAVAAEDDRDDLGVACQLPYQGG